MSNNYPERPTGWPKMTLDKFRRVLAEIDTPLSTKSTAPQGWVCPRCGNVYAPDVPVCLNCASEPHPLSRAERRRKHTAQGGGR